jgi:hypothetical protein
MGGPDLVSNIDRGRLAEFIVARALGMGKTDARKEWDVVEPKSRRQHKA